MSYRNSYTTSIKIEEQSSTSSFYAKIHTGINYFKGKLSQLKQKFIPEQYKRHDLWYYLPDPSLLSVQQEDAVRQVEQSINDMFETVYELQLFTEKLPSGILHDRIFFDYYHFRTYDKKELEELSSLYPYYPPIIQAYQEGKIPFNKIFAFDAFNLYDEYTRMLNTWYTSCTFVKEVLDTLEYPLWMPLNEYLIQNLDYATHLFITKKFGRGLVLFADFQSLLDKYVVWMDGYPLFLAQAYGYCDDNENAAYWYRRQLNLKPSDANAFFGLFWSLYETGVTQDCYLWLLLARKYDPENKYYQKMEQDLIEEHGEAVFSPFRPLLELYTGSGVCITCTYPCKRIGEQVIGNENHGEIKVFCCHDYSLMYNPAFPLSKYCDVCLQVADIRN